MNVHDPVVADLIAQLRDDADERRRRFPHPYNFDRVLQEARSDRLFVPTGAWFHEVLVGADGVPIIRVNERSKGDIERPPENPREANYVWSYVVEVYPELAGAMPARPADAVACPECGGTGQPSWRKHHPNIRCTCGGVGWLPPGHEAMQVFADDVDLSSTSTGVAPAPRSAWARVRRWLGLGG